MRVAIIARSAITINRKSIDYADNRVIMDDRHSIARASTRALQGAARSMMRHRVAQGAVCSFYRCMFLYIPSSLLCREARTGNRPLLLVAAERRG